MKNILLIDADSKIPNLALMKLSAYHKSIGNNVELKKLNLSYYRPNKIYYVNYLMQYDIIYCSVIFNDNYKYIVGDNIIFGGTGFNMDVCLPDEIENISPDYSIYPDNNISYGFISRGCIRKCPFCNVWKKEGSIRQVQSVDNIVKHKQVKFLDNNFLALPNHKDILIELINKKIKCQFNQGFDIRLIDEENSKLISQLKYLGDYIFAFDDWKYKEIIENKLKILNWKKDFRFKFYVYVDDKMPISDTIKRIEFLRQHKCLPYIMRDIKIKDSKYNDFYTDLSSYCNQVDFFKKKSFDEYLFVRLKSKKRRLQHSEIYNKNK